MADLNSTPTACTVNGANILSLAGDLHTLPAALVGRLLASDASAVVTEAGRQFINMPDDSDGCLLPAGALPEVLQALRLAGGELEVSAEGARVVLARGCEGRAVVSFLDAGDGADLVTLDRADLERLQAHCAAALASMAH